MCEMDGKGEIVSLFVIVTDTWWIIKNVPSSTSHKKNFETARFLLFPL